MTKLIANIIESKPFCLLVPYKKPVNPKGKCCCNCKWQRPISGHPWNKNELTKSSVTTVIGWGCTVYDMPNIIFFDKEHSLCEMHDYK